MRVCSTQTEKVDNMFSYYKFGEQKSTVLHKKYRILPQTVFVALLDDGKHQYNKLCWFLIKTVFTLKEN